MPLLEPYVYFSNSFFRHTACPPRCDITQSNIDHAATLQNLLEERPGVCLLMLSWASNVSPHSSVLYMAKM